MKIPCFSLRCDDRPARPPERFNPPSQQHEYEATQRPDDEGEDKKMLESRPKDALVKLLRLWRLWRL